MDDHSVIMLRSGSSVAAIRRDAACPVAFRRPAVSVPPLCRLGDTEISG
jgi:hypothetical protein